MPRGRFVPPDPSKGDPNTIGGYRAVHDRPAAFEGPDGFSYSAEIVAEEIADPEHRWGAYLLFVRWHRVGHQGPSGHLETDYLARGASEREVIDDVARLPLAHAKALLDACVGAAQGATTTRRWWNVARDERDDDEDLH